MTDPSDKPHEPTDPLFEERILLGDGEVSRARANIALRWAAAETDEERVLLRLFLGECAFVNAEPVSAMMSFDEVIQLLNQDGPIPTYNIGLRVAAETGRAIASCVQRTSLHSMTMEMLNFLATTVATDTRAGPRNPILAKIYLAQSVVSWRIGEPDIIRMDYLDRALEVCDATDRRQLAQIYLARAGVALLGGEDNHEGIIDELRSCDELISHGLTAGAVRQQILLQMVTVDFADIVHDSALRVVAGLHGQELKNRLDKSVRLGLDMEYKLFMGRQVPRLI